MARANGIPGGDCCRERHHHVAAVDADPRGAPRRVVPMMHNPLASPLFMPTVLRLGALLLAGALLVAVSERRYLRHPRSLGQSTLFKRVLSWTLMAPTFALGVFVGG